MTLPHIAQLSTNTPASEISSASFNDDSGNSERSEQAFLDDILRNSPAAAALGIDTGSLPEEDEVVPAQESESDNEVPEGSEDEESTDNEESNEDSEDDAKSEDDKSTSDYELPTEEDIDWEYKVPVTINGKTEHLTLEEIRKGYATDKHLSSKGRELGEQKKQLELERSEKLNSLIEMGTLVHEELTAVETSLSSQYHKINADFEKARDEGDTYAARELKEQRETIQEQYWKARKSREEKTELISKRLQKDQQERQQELLKAYGANISKLIPDYSDKVAKSVREFALKEGIPAQLLESIYDPTVVKFINDYRKLKTAKEVGAAKRTAPAPTKSIPTKSGVTPQRREQENASNSRSKVLTGNGSKQDELDFLKRISSVSKKL